jgi:hypothetical protein
MIITPSFLHALYQGNHPGPHSGLEAGHIRPATEVASSARLRLFQPASFNPFELFSARYLKILLTKAKPLSCPLDIPDVFVNEASVTIFNFLLSDHVSNNQLVMVLPISSCAVL